MNNKVDTLGTLWIALGALQLVIGVFMALMFTVLGGVAGIAAAQDDPAGGLVAGGVMVFMAVFIFAIIVLTAVPGILGGMALKKRKGWARILLMVLGAMSLFSFPLGTAIGVWTFVVLLDQGVAAEF